MIFGSSDPMVCGGCCQASQSIDISVIFICSPMEELIYLWAYYDLGLWHMWVNN